MDFYKKMTLVCQRIPEGKVATYGQIALLCRKPRNSRQVGYGLKNGLAGEGIPAHRVVNAKGILSGAEYFETMDMQKLLLEAEGVKIIRGDYGYQVDLKQFRWEHTVEDLRELEEEFQSVDASEESDSFHYGNKNGGIHVECHRNALGVSMQKNVAGRPLVYLDHSCMQKNC